MEEQDHRTDRRAMVTMRRIAALAPIAGADRIEAARVDGWWVVVAKGAFAPGQDVLYCEIDSFIPADPRFGLRDELATTWRGRRGHRLMTATMKGQVSQGLALDPGRFPEVAARVAGKDAGRLRGLDLSDMVGVVKWEADIPAEIAAAAVGRLPSRIGSTSLPRLQNLPGLFADHAGARFAVSLKVNGMAFHSYHLDGRTRVACGHWELRETTGSAVWAAARSSGLHAAMAAMAHEGLQVQAEVYGRATRAGHHEGREGAHLAIFHARDNAAGRDFAPDELRELVDELRGLAEAAGVPHSLELAPQLGEVALDDYAADPSRLFELAEGPSIDPKRRREGVVLRRIDKPSFAFKIISDKGLLRRR